jgi:hypothetical protein
MLDFQVDQLLKQLHQLYITAVQAGAASIQPMTRLEHLLQISKMTGWLGVNPW